MADINTIRAKIVDALNEEVRLVNVATPTLKQKIQDALSEVDIVLSPPTPSTTITFTEGTPARVSVAALLPSVADRYHGGWELQTGGYNTGGSTNNWLPGVYFDPATKEMVYTGAAMSANSSYVTPNTGYYVGSENGPYSSDWSFPPVYDIPPNTTTVSGRQQSQSLYAGSKHTFFKYRPVDGKVYNMGGDFATYEAVWNPDIYHAQDGAPVYWRWDPRLSGPAAWERYYPSLGKTGEQVPLDADRMNWDYDSGRDIFWFSFGSVRVGSFFGNNVPPNTPASSVNRYFKGVGGIAQAVPETPNDNNDPLLIYDPKTESMRYACASPILYTPWTQANNTFMQAGAYHNASKRLYTFAVLSGNIVVYYLDTTPFETNPAAMTWVQVLIDTSKTTPPMQRPYNIGRTWQHWVDDTKNLIYFFHAGINQVIYGLTLPGHPLGEHKVVSIADISAYVGYDINDAPSGTGLGTESPFIFIPEKRCLVLCMEPSEEMVGPYTRSLQINVDTGAVKDGPRFPNSDQDGMPWFPNAGFWYPPTQELVLYGISIMNHARLGGNRSWDNPSGGGGAVVPLAYCRYQWTGA